MHESKLLFTFEMLQHFIICTYAYNLQIMTMEEKNVSEKAAFLRITHHMRNRIVGALLIFAQKLSYFSLSTYTTFYFVNEINYRISIDVRACV